MGCFFDVGGGREGDSPLHIAGGSRRRAGVGALANLLRSAGYNVSTEYYINDAGRQVHLMAASVTAVQNPTSAPEDGYKGAYIVDLAKQLQEKQQAGVLRTGLTNSEVAEWASSQLLNDIKTDLQAFNLRFDRWFSEQKELFNSGAVAQAPDWLRQHG